MRSVTIDNLTTVAHNRLPMFPMPEFSAPASLLYFRLTMHFDGAIFDADERRRLKRILRASTETFGGKTESAGFDGERVQLPVGPPARVILADFVERLRILFRFAAQRRLQAKNFAWREGCQISTVGFSQLKIIDGDIRRKDSALGVATAPRFELSTID